MEKSNGFEEWNARNWVESDGTSIAQVAQEALRRGMTAEEMADELELRAVYTDCELTELDSLVNDLDNAMQDYIEDLRARLTDVIDAEKDLERDMLAVFVREFFGEYADMEQRGRLVAQVWSAMGKQWEGCREIDSAEWSVGEWLSTALVSAIWPEMGYSVPSFGA